MFEDVAIVHSIFKGRMLLFPYNSPFKTEDRRQESQKQLLMLSTVADAVCVDAVG